MGFRVFSRAWMWIASVGALMGMLAGAPYVLSQTAPAETITPAQLLQIDAAPNPSALFNHDKTGYHLDGAHATARCLGCHGNRVLKGTPRQCSGCHIQGNRSGTLITQGNSHIVTNINVACDACHTSLASFRIWRMDHNATPLAAGRQCSTCHTGQSFEGVVPRTKPANHPVTTADCSLCHMTFSTFALVNRFDHVGAGIFPGMHICSNCHNGSQAQGRPVGHIPIRPTECDYCHNNTSSFFTTGMDHASAGITVGGGGCITCHNGQAFYGVTPVTKVSGHVPTTANCEACHTATDPVPGGFAFVIATFNHAASGNPNAVDGSHGCVSCHNGTNATGKATGHVPTTAACDLCHKTTDANFTMAVMNHSGITSGCTACHSGQTFVGVTPVAKPAGVAHIPTTQDCVLCHKNTNPGGFASYAMDHTGIATGCINCHNIGSPYVTTIPNALVTLPASGHIPTSAGCETCHTSTTVPGGFKIYSFNHTGIASGCALCHYDGSNYAYLPVSPPQIVTRTQPVLVQHIPTSAPCEWCHTSTTIPGGFKTWTMNHTGIVSGCGTCHGTKSGPLYPGVMNQLASHVNTGAQDCGACHTSTAMGGFSLAASTFDHVKAGVLAGSCTNCHNGTFATGQVTGHITTAVQCDVCHNYSYGAFSIWKMNHAGVATTCSASCHGTGKTFFGATMVTLPANHFPIAAADCSACHTPPALVSSPGGGTGFATWTMSHSAVTAITCQTCHG
jgi:hypothetical protein